MFVKIPFSEKEMEAVDYRPGMFGGPDTPIKNTPVSPRQNTMSLFYEKKPYWMPMSGEIAFLKDPWTMHMGRGGHEPFVDDLGVEWLYEPTAGGSIVHPERPQLLEDVNDWKEKVHLPDPSKWNWEEMVAQNKIDTRYSMQTSYTNGFGFERLISMMGFVPAAMALLDEEQTDAIKEMNQAFADFACQVIDLQCKYYPAMDIINFHDDWGSQQSTFFSEQIAREIYLPYMKQICDCIHAHGRIASLHSCGHNDKRVEVFIEAGFDEWGPQTMNDIEWLYDNYGDKIVFAVWPDRDDIASLSDEEQVAEARKFVDRFSAPGKPATMSIQVTRTTGKAFQDEVYRYSRQLYAERG